jgi:hypothetical protein
MSQRSALLLSLALTVLVGFAIVSNRDRLLGASSASPQPTPTVQDASAQLDNQASDASQLTPRIVEITLPVSQSSQRSAFDDDDRYEDDDEHEEDDDDD